MALKDKVNTAKDVLSDTRSRMVLVILAILVIVVLVVAVIKFKRSEVAPAGRGSSMTGVPAITSIPGMGEPTREYAKLQEQQNIQLAEEAVRTGTSAMPTVVRTTYLETGASADLMKGSGAESAEGCDVESLKRARASGVTAAELRCRGCSLAALRAAGFTAGELRAAGYSASELKDAGFSAAELKESGFSAEQLSAAGFNAGELSAAGFTAGELKNAGFSDEELEAAGFNKAEIKAAGEVDACSPRKLRQARSRGVKASELRKSGCSAAALRSAGYSAAELKAAGFSAGELMAAGFSAKELKDAGFSAAELKNAGFSAEALAGAGFTADELSSAGFTPGELTRAGLVKEETKVVKTEVSLCSVEGLKKARAKGISAINLKKQGCSIAALKAAGYTVEELKAAGFNANELKAAGFVPEKSEDKVMQDVGDLGAQHTSVQDEMAKYNAEKIAAMGEQEKEDFMRQQQAMMRMQANNLFAAWTPIPSQGYVQGQETKDKNVHSVAATTEEQAAIDLKNSDVYKAGSIVFSVLDTGVNSDENSPVMATIVQGPLKGSKVLGNFQRVDKKVLLKFSVLSVPKLDTSIPINAVAVDPNTAKTAIASKVDNHYFLRYGLLFASSFVSGLGQAFQNAGSQVTTSTTGSVISMPVLTFPQKGIVALGNTAQQFGQAMATKIDTPPTVKVDPGTSVGLLLMADLAVPKSQKDAT